MTVMLFLTVVLGVGCWIVSFNERDNDREASSMMFGFGSAFLGLSGICYLLSLYV